MAEDILADVNTAFGHYQVADCIYNGRPARVLYSGDHRAAQSGMALDGNDELLFDYNQRFMELIEELKPKRLLLIGGGALTLPIAVMRACPGTYMDVVELDEGLVDIAAQYFGFKETPQVGVHITDGRRFLASSNARYDLIIIDAFIHTKIPQELQTIEALAAYAKHLNPGGVIAANVIAAYHGPRAQQLRRYVAAAVQSCSNCVVAPASSGLSPWLPQNYVVIASQQPLDRIVRSLRFPCYDELPHITSADAQSDEV